MKRVAGGERRLVIRAQAGDDSAFEQLYLRHRTAIRDNCRRMLRGSDEADDVVQEAFVRAYARIDSLREPDAFVDWLNRISRHALVDLVRHRERFGLPWVQRTNSRTFLRVWGKYRHSI